MNKKVKVILVVTLFVLLIVFLICNRILTKKEIDKNVEIKTASLFQDINKSSIAKVNNFIIYGTHFNLDGSIEIPKISNISIYSVHIIAKNTEKKRSPTWLYLYI